MYIKYLQTAGALKNYEKLLLENFNIAQAKDSFEFFHDKGLRGLRTTKFIPKGKQIMCIPRQKLLKQSLLKNIPGLKRAFGQFSRPHPEVTLLLMYYKLNDEKIPEYLLPYIKTLPSDVPEHVLSWDKLKYEQYLDTSVTNTNCYPNYHDYHKNVQQECEKAYQMYSDSLIELSSDIYLDKDDFFSLFKKIRPIFSTRCFSSLGDSVMVPIADLMNTCINPKPNTRWYTDYTTGNFIVESVMDIPKGKELTDSYGSTNTNPKYLMHYGFTFPENPYDVVKLKVNGQIVNLTINNVNQYKSMQPELDIQIDEYLKKLNLKDTSNDLNFKRIIESEKNILKKHKSTF